jgi:hypothetical protein
MGYTPIQPEDSDFWNQFLNTCKAVRKSRGKVIIPNGMLSNTLREKFRIYRYDQLAQLVHLDMPPEIITKLSEYLLQKGVKFRNITNEGNYANFTNGVVLLCRLLGWAIHFVSPTCFAHKYFHGAIRQEEVAGAIVRGELEPTQGIMDQFNSIVSPSWRKEIEKDQRAFTMYPEGCPNHPQIPQMHGSASAVSLILPIMLDVNKEQLHEIRQVAYDIAFGRVCAGVHDEQSIYYALDLGERIISEILPRKLEELGADESEVMGLISKYRHNWKDYFHNGYKPIPF